jgi:hypothetical protein
LLPFYLFSQKGVDWRDHTTNILEEAHTLLPFYLAPPPPPPCQLAQATREEEKLEGGKDGIDIAEEGERGLSQKLRRQQKVWASFCIILRRGGQDQKMRIFFLSEQVPILVYSFLEFIPEGMLVQNWICDHIFKVCIS